MHRKLLLCAVTAGMIQVAPAQTTDGGRPKPVEEIVDTISPSSRTLTPTLAEPFKPITGGARMRWFVNGSVGFESLAIVGPLSAGWGTWRGSPPEYPNNITGFGQRYGMRLTGVVVDNAISASAGAVWGEDPRYFRKGDGSFKGRAFQIIRSTYMSRYRDGEYHLAWARFAGNAGNNFLSNMWRVPSQSTTSEAAIRCGWGLLDRMAANAFSEFWPDIKNILRRKK